MPLGLVELEPLVRPLTPRRLRDLLSRLRKGQHERFKLVWRRNSTVLRLQLALDLDFPGAGPLVANRCCFSRQIFVVGINRDGIPLELLAHSPIEFGTEVEKSLLVFRLLPNSHSVDRVVLFPTPVHNSLPDADLIYHRSLSRSCLQRVDDISSRLHRIRVVVLPEDPRLLPASIASNARVSASADVYTDDVWFVFFFEVMPVPLGTKDPVPRDQGLFLSDMRELSEDLANPDGIRILHLETRWWNYLYSLLHFARISF